ncbi:hypothetical protein ACF0H5_017551 [Mactra antiquata]
MVLFSSASDCVYTSCYCEENVWHLCDSVRQNHPAVLDNCYCIFISNRDRTVPLWEQKASNAEDGVVLWDYHVIFIHCDGNECLVYDLDSRLDFPCNILTYIEKGILSCDHLKPQYKRLFRVIPAPLYLKTFASDRTHMLDKDKKWMKPPPSYPCIKTEASTNNIDDFINMDFTVGVGEVMNSTQFCEKFLKRSRT